ncbi:cilia- and flagella-associated protein 68 isoform X4 [Symphalangus syndactylus]|uniref:cilia- and flagella-associated protein 68 isoform X4 n=1 Tax=Symphalangus syndactylus TaxID=9590 RepID=UPI00300796BE
MAASQCLCCSKFLLQRQNLTCFLTNPHCGSLINADGHGEVWTDWNNMSKFSQYGWRCTTNENTYSNRTLMGNWNQESLDTTLKQHMIQATTTKCHFQHIDLSESLTGSQDINLNWILPDTNAQKSQLT